jgi:hypothetical protein
MNIARSNNSTSQLDLRHIKIIKHFLLRLMIVAEMLDQYKTSMSYLYCF